MDRKRPVDIAKYGTPRGRTPRAGTLHRLRTASLAVLIALAVVAGAVGVLTASPARAAVSTGSDPTPSYGPGGALGPPASAYYPSPYLFKFSDTGFSDGSSATLTVPAGALPVGTLMGIYPVINPSPVEAQIPPGSRYLVSFAAFWTAPDSSSPPATQPVELAIRHPNIRPGDTVWLETSNGIVAVPATISGGQAVVAFTEGSMFVVTAPVTGYWEASADGRVGALGDASSFGSLAGVPLNKPIVGIAADPATGGYWLVASDGGVFSFNAPSLGSTGAIHLNQPIVGMASTSDGKGYWLVASDGGIFAFGDAGFQGSMGGQQLNKPIVGMAEDPYTGGYWLVASDGGIFSFHAQFYGSTGAFNLNKPIVGMAADAPTGGYWLVASDGGIFSFNAQFFGSTGSLTLNEPIVGMAADPLTGGYWLAASDGGIFSFNAPFEGSRSATSPLSPTVGVAAQ